MKTPKVKKTQADIAEEAARNSRMAANQAKLDADERRRRARGRKNALLTRGETGSPALTRTLGVPAPTKLAA